MNKKIYIYTSRWNAYICIHFLFIHNKPQDVNILIKEEYTLVAGSQLLKYQLQRLAMFLKILIVVVLIGVRFLYCRFTK